MPIGNNIGKQSGGGGGGTGGATDLVVLSSNDSIIQSNTSYDAGTNTITTTLVTSTPNFKQILVDCTSGNQTRTLDPITNFISGTIAQNIQYIKSDATSNTLTILASSGTTIRNGTTSTAYVIRNQNSTVTFQPYSDNIWIRIANTLLENYGLQPFFITSTGSVNQWGCVVYVNASAGNVTLSLPNINIAPTTGGQITVFKTDNTTNSVTINPTSGNTINGVNSYSLAKQNDYVTLTNNTTTDIKITNSTSSGGGGSVVVNLNPVNQPMQNGDDISAVASKAQGQINADRVNITNNTTNITTNTANITTLQGNVQTINGQITNINTTLATKQDKLSSANAGQMTNIASNGAIQAAGVTFSNDTLNNSPTILPTSRAVTEAINAITPGGSNISKNFTTNVSKEPIIYGQSEFSDTQTDVIFKGSGRLGYNKSSYNYLNYLPQNTDAGLPSECQYFTTTQGAQNDGGIVGGAFNNSGSDAVSSLIINTTFNASTKRAFIIYVAYVTSGVSSQVSSMTMDVKNCTFKRRFSSISNTYIEIWECVPVSSLTSATITITMSAPVANLIGECITLYDVNNLNLIANISDTSNGNPVTTANLNIVSIPKQLILSFLAIYTSTSPGHLSSPQTIVTYVDNVNLATAVSSQTAISDLTNSSFTFDSSIFVMVNIAINALEPALPSYKKTTSIMQQGLNSACFIPMSYDITTGGGTTQLLINDNTFIRIFGSNTQTIVTPNATKLLLGTNYTFFNNSSQPIPIKNFTNNTITTVSVGAILTINLCNNINSAGDWKLQSGGGMALVSNPTANDFLMTNSSGQAIDSGLSFSTSPSSNSPTEIIPSSVIQSIFSTFKTFRGSYDASSNVFPSTGGSGAGGAIVAGNTWLVTVGGTLGGKIVYPNDQLLALVNNPAQSSANWFIANTDITSVNGFTSGDIVITVANLGDTSISIPSNGQTLIWNNTLGKWVNRNLTSTSNQLVITNGTGSIDFSFNPQISPTFASMLLTNNTNQIRLGTTNVMTVTMATQNANHTFTLPNANSNPIQPLGDATLHKWVQYINNAGEQILAQPTFDDIAGTAQVAQGGTGTTTSTGGGSVVLNTAPSLTNPTINNYQIFTPQATNPTYSRTQLFYDDTNDALSYYNANGDVAIGQEVFYRAYNNTASAIPAGSVVYNTGLFGSTPTIALATGTIPFVGVTKYAIPSNSVGIVVTAGTITGLNTSNFTANDTLYLSDVTAGGITNGSPMPAYPIKIGKCGVVSATVGSILVNLVNLIAGESVTSAVRNATNAVNATNSINSTNATNATNAVNATYATNLTGGTSKPYPYQSASNVTSYYNAQELINQLANGTTSGQYLRGNGTNILLSAIQASDVPTLNQNTTGTAQNAVTLTGAAVNSVPYQQSAGLTTYLPAIANNVFTTDTNGKPTYINYVQLMQNGSVIGTGGAGNNTTTIYVSNLNGSDTNNGYTPQTAVATLGRAQTLMSNGQGVIMVIGSSVAYNETVTLSTLNNVTIMSDAYNGSVSFSGTITVNNSSSSLTFKGISIANLVKQGAGALYLYKTNVYTSFSNTGTGYFQASLCSDLQGNGSVTNSFTGAGISVIDTGSYVGVVTINNVSASVGMTNIGNSKAITVTAGVLSLNNSIVYAPSNITNAINVASGAVLYAGGNTRFIVANTVNPAIINIASGSFYSFTSVYYNPTGSIIAGNNTIAIPLYFDKINLLSALSITNGGTGATTKTTALNNLLPDQIGNAGKILSTNGTNASWITALSSALPDGQIWVGNASGVASPVSLSGDATLINTGAITISNNVVTNAKLANMPAKTIKGNNTASSATPIDMTTADVVSMLSAVTCNTPPSVGQFASFTGNGNETIPVSINGIAVGGQTLPSNPYQVGTIRVQIAPFSGGNGIQIASITGTITVNMLTEYSYYGTNGASYQNQVKNATVTTTFSNPLSWGFTNQALNGGQVTVQDLTNNKIYIIWFSLFNNNPTPSAFNGLKIEQIQ